MQKGEPVVVKFFGEHVVWGTIEDADKTKATVAFGHGAWAVTAPRTWVRQDDADWVLELG